MVNYVERSTQTEIQGLCKDPAPVPQSLQSLQPPADTPTPPEDMALDKSQLSPVQVSPASESKPSESKPSESKPVPKISPDDQRSANTNLQPSMLLKRKQRPPMVARISLPSTDYQEDPPSPPPTEALMSPLPAANKLHAGHTPIIPQAMSPVPPSEGPASPGLVEDEGLDADEGLSGPLILPPRPGDGTEDTIPLSVLDKKLEKLAMGQERSLQHSDEAEPDPDPMHEDEAAPLSRRASRESGKHATDEAEVVDGVILKKPKMNMGAPLGQA